METEMEMEMEMEWSNAINEIESSGSFAIEQGRKMKGDVGTNRYFGERNRQQQLQRASAAGGFLFGKRAIQQHKLSQPHQPQPQHSFIHSSSVRYFHYLHLNLAARDCNRNKQIISFHIFFLLFFMF